MREEHEPITAYKRIYNSDDTLSDMWEKYDDGLFVAMLFTDELPFELPIHAPQEMRDNANKMFHYMDDERLQNIIDSIDPFEIEFEELRRFE